MKQVFIGALLCLSVLATAIPANQCRALSAGCTDGDEQACKGYEEIGCKCDAKGNVCLRGSYEDK